MANSIFLHIDPNTKQQSFERVIISGSDIDSRTFIFRVVGEGMVDIFKKILVSIDLSHTTNISADQQLVGGVTVFKIDPEMMEKMFQNSDLSEINIVVDSGKTVYGILRRFLITDEKNYEKTVNEIINYMEIYSKTILSKYGITSEKYLTNYDEIMFLIFGGTQKSGNPTTPQTIITGVNQQLKNGIDLQQPSSLSQDVVPILQTTNQNHPKVSIDDELKKEFGGHNIAHAIYEWFADAVSGKEKREEKQKKDIEKRNAKLDYIKRKKDLEKTLNDPQDSQTSKSSPDSDN
jgi:hypothetical protein